MQVDGSALTALQLIDDAIFADDAAFTLTSSKAAVVGAIRDDTLSTLAAAEGDVVPLRVSSTGALHVTGSAGTTQYAEDAAHASGDSGVVCLAVRRDSAASSSGTDGDYSTLNTNATGALRVTIDSFANSQTDDAAFTPGTSLVSVVAAEFDDTTPDSVDEGDAGALRMSANRNLYSTIRDAAGNERGANVNASGQLSVTGPVTNAGTFAVQVDGNALTALQIIDNPVFADDAAFTLASSSVSMAGAIRDDSLSTLTAVEGDAVPLRVSSTGALHVTGGGGGTEYTVDVAAPAAPTGATFVMERDDALSALTEVEGDWTNPRSSANGALWVSVDGSVAVTDNAGSLTVDNAALSVTGGGVEASALRVTIANDSTGVLSVDDNGSTISVDDGAGSLTVDNAALSVTGGGVEASALRVTIANDSTGVVSVDDNGGSLTVDGTVAVSSISTSVTPGTGATNLGKAEDGAHTSGDVGVMALAVRTDTPANRSGTDGDYEPLQVSAGRVWASATVTSLPASTNTLEVVGDAADDAATAGNPVLVGGVAVETDGTDPTTVSAEGDAAYLRTDRARRVLVSTVHPRLFRASADYASAQTNATVQAAPGAGLSNYITDVIVSNGATAGNITLLDGSGGTVLLELYPAVNGGLSHTFHTPIRQTANTLLAITSTTVTTHTVTVTGYIAP